MKSGIHPDYHMITITMTDGTKYQSRSTYGKEGDNLQLDVDPKTHPAWVGGANLRKTGQLEKFENKFKSFGAKKPDPKAAASTDNAKKADATSSTAKKDEKKDDAQA